MKLECNTTKWFIIHMSYMSEKLVVGIFLCPIDNCSICLSPISFTLLIDTYPDSDIYRFFFCSIDSYCSEKISRISMNNKILKHFIVPYCYHCIFYIFKFIFYIRLHIIDPSMYICPTKLIGQLS